MPKFSADIEPIQEEGHNNDSREYDRSTDHHLDHHHNPPPAIQEEEEDILFVENLFCTVCNLEQTLRSKHCRDCKRCIATYDHHCPWMGTCIGEKNRKDFFIYICC